MAQRVMIAMAIACGPEVLLADEPTTALDVTVQAAILETIDSLRRELGMAVMLITHDLGVVAAVADRVMVMYAGRSIETGPVDELFRQPAHPYTRGLQGAMRRPDRIDGRITRLTEIPGIVPVVRRPATSCTFAPRCAEAIARCVFERPEATIAGPDHEVVCFVAAERVSACR